MNANLMAKMTVTNSDVSTPRKNHVTKVSCDVILGMMEKHVGSMTVTTKRQLIISKRGGLVDYH